MAENDDGEPSAGRGPRMAEGSGSAYRRLEGELTTFRTKFDGLAAESETEGHWVDRGRELLDAAEAALEAGNVERGWNYLHGAERLAAHGVEAVGGAAALRGEARELLVEARSAPLGWRADAIRERIATPDGTPREDLTVLDLHSAKELLHEGYERVHRKRQHLQSQFATLRRAGVAIVLLFLAVAAVGAVWSALPTPLYAFEGNATVTTGGAGSTEPVGFLVYVVLSGMLGASLFGIRSLRKQPASSSTPQYLSGSQAAAARIVVGAGSALAVFLFLRAELLTVAMGAGTTAGPFLLAIAFVAGYSQRLVHATVESVANTAEPESGGDGAG